MALGSCPRKSDKNNIGERNLEIQIDGISIKPGNWCYADENGILISEQELQI